MSANATADATNNIAFKIPASKVVDVFAYNASGSAKLAFGPLWTNTTTRATALTTKDGVPVLSGSYSISGTAYTEGKLKWIGTIGTTTVAGQTEDSSTGRYVWNKYHKVRKSLKSYNTDTSWVIGSSFYPPREYQNGTNQIRGKFVIGESQFFQLAMCAYIYYGATNDVIGCQMALDTTTGVIGDGGTFAIYGWTGYAPFIDIGPAVYAGSVVAGYHYFTQIEYATIVSGATHYPGGGDYDILYTLWEG